MSSLEETSEIHEKNTSAHISPRLLQPRSVMMPLNISPLAGPPERDPEHVAKQFHYASEFICLNVIMTIIYVLYKTETE